MPNSNTYYQEISSPLGKILIIANETHLTQLHFSTSRYYPKIENHYQKTSNHPIIQETKKQLQEYFQKTRQTFDLPLHPQGTPFQEKIWQTLQTIIYGKTASYHDIATLINQPTASRAVGSAIGKNPISIIIPCHRIISKNGSLNQYAGGITCKKHLLTLENSSKIT